MKKTILAIVLLVSILSYGQTNISTNNIKASGTLNVKGQATLTSGDFINSGIFTDTQMNQYVRSSIGGFNFLSEFQIAEGNHGSTEAFSGGVVTPVGATVLQAAGINGYALNSSTFTFNYGGYFQSRCALNGTRCGGINPVALDTTGLTSGITMYGSDLVVAPRNANTVYNIVDGYSASLAGIANGQAYGQAFDCSTQSTSLWGFCFRARDGAGQTALQAGASCTSGTCSSQTIGFTSFNGGVAQFGNFNQTPSGTLNFNSPSTISLQISDGTHSNTATIASGTAVMTTAAITGPSCGATVTVAATGVTTSDVITFTDNSAPTTNGPLIIKAWPTANNVNFFYCVQSGTITPAAATLNWRVAR